MNERFGFKTGSVWLVGCIAAFAVGCGDNPCTTAETQITEVCGDAYDLGPFTAGCNSMAADATACNTCIATALEGGDSACADLATTCRMECFCPTGICPSPDGGEDAGMDDAGPIIPVTCGTSGRAGATCRGGTSCVSPLMCQAEVTSLPMGGGAATYGNLFNPPIPNGTEDENNPGEYIAGSPSTVPVGFAPGGLCTERCSTAQGAADVCTDCATCTTALGPPGAVPLLSTQSFTAANDANPGVCRLNCTFDPDGRGAPCAAGYTCDPSTNICVEACTDASQCNARFGNSAGAFPFGLVEYQLDPPQYTCGADTGRCEWTNEDAAFGDECTSDGDCPTDVGSCVFGHCTTSQCNLQDANGGTPYACPTGTICGGFGGNGGAICFQTCESPSDCFDDQACLPSTQAGQPSICFGYCEADAECGDNRRCAIGAFGTQAPDLGTCEPVCDHLPDDGMEVPNAVECAADEACVEVENAAEPPVGLGWGQCEPLNGLCGSDDFCNGNQACFFEGLTMLGRCVDGCANNEECNSGEFCVIQDDEDGNPRPLGVCRAPDGVCAESGRFAQGAMDPYQELLGDEQCVEGQTCNAATGMEGTCEGDAPDAGPPVDAGPVDAGPEVDAGPVDAGPEVDAGPVDAGPVDAGPVDAGPVDAGT